MRRTTGIPLPRPGLPATRHAARLPASPAVTSTLDEAVTDLDHTRWPAGLDATSTPPRRFNRPQRPTRAADLGRGSGLRPDRRPRPRAAFVAGHSVGAFAAAVTAGVLVRRGHVGGTAARRSHAAELLERSVGDGGACWVCDRPQSGALVDRASADEPVWIANINAADQIVLSGSIAALERAKAASRLAGARRWEPLDVTVASTAAADAHCRADGARGRPSAPRQRVAYPDQHWGPPCPC